MLGAPQMISNTNKSSYYHNVAIRGPKGWNFEDFGNTKIGKILNNGLSLSLLRTFYLPQIIILPDSELKLSK